MSGRPRHVNPDLMTEVSGQGQSNTQQLRELVRMRRRGIFIYALPNLFTSANLLFGFLAITLAFKGQYVNAAWAILLASVFDLLDGRVARLTDTTTSFGVEFDSLCDLVSFGMAPSLLMYVACLQNFGRFGLAVAIIFALCGALRLARFNVLASVLPKAYFQGLPIPIASAAVATSVFFAQEIGFDITNSIAVLLMVLVLGLLMITTFRFPSFKDTHFRHRKSFTQVGFLFMVIVGLVLWFELSSFLFLVAYIAFSLGADILRQIRRKSDLSTVKS